MDLILNWKLKKMILTFFWHRDVYISMGCTKIISVKNSKRKKKIDQTGEK